MYLIDTNILIYHTNGSIPDQARNQVREILINHFVISIISKIEFLGFSKLNSETYQICSEFLAQSEVIPLTDEIANKTIELRRSSSIKLADGVIAATALINNLTLVTRNTDDFKNTPLKVYNPFQ